LEGGDIFTLTNNRGEKTVLIGAQLFTLIHAYMRHDESIKNMFDETSIQATFSDEEIQRAEEEMYAMGLLKVDGKLGLIEEGKYKQTALVQQIKSSFKYAESGRAIAIKYLKQKIFLQGLLERTFQIPKGNLHVISQLACHLDMFMMPGPNKTVFFQDYDLCHKLLLSIKENAEAFSLTSKDMVFLDRYIHTAETLNKEASPILIKARKEIEEAGFTVLSAPGIINDEDKSKGEETHHIDFLNAISGWSSKNKRPYVATLGAQVGDRLGVVLMDLFKHYLKEYQKDLEVHFLNYDPKNPSDFSQSMYWMNNRLGETKKIAGLHCLTLEESSKSHVYP